jgi:hypothetical protein
MRTFVLKRGNIPRAGAVAVPASAEALRRKLTAGYNVVGLPLRTGNAGSGIISQGYNIVKRNCA